jgi:hypothetical protein
MIFGINQSYSSSYFRYVFSPKEIKVQRIFLKEKQGSRIVRKYIKGERLEQLKVDIGLLSAKDIKAKYEISDRRISKITNSNSIKTKKANKIQKRNERIHELHAQYPEATHQKIANMIQEEGYGKFSLFLIRSVLNKK